MELPNPINLFYARNAMTGQRHINFIPNWAARLLGGLIMGEMWLFEPTAAPEHPHAQIVNQIANRLLPHVWNRPDLAEQRKQIHVIPSDWFVNAGSAPGTMNILVGSGLIKKIEKCAKNYGLAPLPVEDRIAAVLAHEIAHSQGEHFGRAMSLEMLVSFPLTVWTGAITVLSEWIITRGLDWFEERKKEHPKAGPLIDLAQTVFMIAEFILFRLKMIPVWIITHRLISQRHEYEADRHGMELLQRAGYDPRALVWMTHWFADREGLAANATLSPYWKMQRWISTHPIGSDRIRAAEEALRQLQA